ncbi:MAG: ABC transporter permease [Eggerthellaceae bacterium]|jgi:sodium transport system permease protein|nr:ABC transporter permease [Eggerthellaceae bacterium]
MLTTAKTVFIKELKSFYASKRLFLNALLIPLIIFPTIMLFASLASSRQVEAKDYILGIFDSDDYLEEIADGLNWQINRIDDTDYEQQLERGTIDVCVAQEADRYVVYYSGNSVSSSTAASLFYQAFASLNEQQNQMVLDVLDSQTVQSKSCSMQNISGSSSAGLLSSTFIPLIIILVCSMSAGVFAVSVTIREREQGTFEPLRATGASSAGVVLGKYVAVVVGCICSGLITLVSIVLYALARPDQMIDLSKGLMTILVVSIVLSSMLFSAVYMLIGFLVRSQREAQTYTGFISIAAMMPAYFLTTAPVGREPGYYWTVPVLNITSMTRDALFGVADLIPLSITACETMIIACVCVVTSIHLFQGERT